MGVFQDGIYAQHELALRPGDRLVLFTDGVTEITNANEEMFGEARLVELIKNNRALDAAALQKTVLAAIKQFGNGDFEDDVTLLALSLD